MKTIVEICKKAIDKTTPLFWVILALAIFALSVGIGVCLVKWGEVKIIRIEQPK